MLSVVVVTLNTVSARIWSQCFIVHFARRKYAFTHTHTYLTSEHSSKGCILKITTFQAIEQQ